MAFLYSGDSSFNTVLPDIENFQGKWGQVLGTAVSHNKFLTSKHVGGRIGDIFEYHDSKFTVISYRELSNSDLIIWEVAGELDDWAEIYDGECLDKQIIIFGRGAPRGKAVYSKNFPIYYGNKNLYLKGWNVEKYDGKIRWGQNIINKQFHFASLGDLLEIDFNLSNDKNQCILTPGDSGGGVFILDQGKLKLIGINYATENIYLALFDERGIVEGKSGNNAIPCKSYITKVTKELVYD
jgi:hypothetical protein